MEMMLRTHYKLKAIPIIQSFVIESAKYFGANEAECKDLKLATEEAALHIIKNYPQSEGEPFDIFCSLENKNLFRVVLSNTGLPIDKENIPEYKVETPEDSIDGLQFYLIKKLMDNFMLLNKGKNGWQTILEKKISHPANQKDKTETKNKSYTEHSQDSLRVGIATPNDAYSITRLAYTTYKYSYAKTIFYYPEMLKEAMQNQSIISFIAKNDNGEIVMHIGTIRSPYSRKIVELGAMMSMQEYRGNKTLLKLSSMQIEFSEDKSNGIDIMEVNLVTGHTGSQKVAIFHKFTPFAIKLSVHNRSEFIGMKNIEQQRESLLYVLKFTRDIGPVNIFIPQEHKDIVDYIFSLTKQSANINPSYGEYEETTKYKINENKDEKFAQIEISKFSKDWQKELKKIIHETKSEGIITVHLTIPAYKPIPSGIDKRLAEIGFFFSGIYPITPQKWVMLYTLLEFQKFDFRNIKIADEKTERLKDYIESCYKKTLDF